MPKRRRPAGNAKRRHLFEQLEARHLLAASPFGTNPLQPLDVTRDGQVTALDALRVINALNRADSGVADPANNVGSFIDVSGDGEGTALDALRVINALNREAPIVAATLPNDSGPAERNDLAFDLITSDYELDLRVSVGGLAERAVEIRIGEGNAFSDITNQFADESAKLTASEIDAVFGQPLPDGDHNITVRIVDGDAINFVLTVDRSAPAPTPTVGDIVRVAPQQLDIDFGEPIADATIDLTNFALRKSGGEAITIESSETIGDTVRLNFPARLDDADFELSFTGTVTDLAGNIATAVTRTFTVADPVGIESITPNVGEREVRVSRDVMIDFDEPIDPSTFDPAMIEIKAAGTQVAGSIRLSSDAQRIIFTPDQSLPRATAITVAINGNQLMGADGLMLDADGDNEPGGSDRVSFTTSSLNVIPGTSVSGYIYDSIRTRPNEPLPIPVPAGDPLFDPQNTGTQTIDFTRAKFQLGTGRSTDDPRVHVNLASSFIDAGMVYGDDEFRAKALRRMDGSSKLKSTTGLDGELLPINNAENFPDGPIDVENRGRRGDDELFVAGDIRASENPQLIGLHSILLREHNRKADELAAANPRLPGNQLYEQSRAWVTALIQHISYQEFLPALIGPDAIPAYTGYQSDVDPSIEAMFSTAAFRFGHSMASESVARLDAAGNSLSGGPLSFRNAFFTPDPLLDDGLEPYLRGMVGTLTSELDTQVNDDLRNFLFGAPGASGLDLVATNIARGRDLGLPDYNQARIDFGLAPVTDFGDITDDVDLAAALRDTYGSVDSIDPWVGGLAETPVDGAIVGPLFAAVIADQFTRTRDADRFWYQNGRFSQAELAEIESTRLSTLIERNTGITGLPTAAMQPGSTLPGAPTGGTAGTGSVSEAPIPGGFGNNINNPLLGNSNRSLRRSDTIGYADGISAPAGADRPNPRTISNAIFNEDAATENQAGLTNLFLIWGQFLDHDLSKTPRQDADTPLNIPVENLTIRVDGLPDVVTTTDANGFFLLEDVPAGKFFVDFDTSTVTSAPEGFGYASTDKPFETLAGRPNAVKEDGKTFDIFLPSFPLDEAIRVTPGEVTTATFGQRSLDVLAELHPDIPAEVWQNQFKVDVPADTLFMDDGSPAEAFQVFALDPARIPAPLPEGLDPSIVFSLSADGANDFGTTAQLTFPNLDGLAPGEVRPIWTFDHDAGEWKITGRAVVSSDGAILETDEGGVTTLGWKGLGNEPLSPVSGDPELQPEDPAFPPPNCDFGPHADALNDNAGIDPSDMGILDTLGLEPVAADDIEPDQELKVKEFGTEIQLAPGDTPEKWFQRLKNDINEAVDSSIFDFTTDFEKVYVPPSGDFQGTLFYIDNAGSDPVAVIASQDTATSFVLQTVNPKTDGTAVEGIANHPFAGSREFGYEVVDPSNNTIYIYNRGVSKTTSGFPGVDAKKWLGDLNYREFVEGLVQENRERGGTGGDAIQEDIFYTDDPSEIHDPSKCSPGSPEGESLGLQKSDNSQPLTGKTSYALIVRNPDTFTSSIGRGSFLGADLPNLQIPPGQSAVLSLFNHSTGWVGVSSTVVADARGVDFGTIVLSGDRVGEDIDSDGLSYLAEEILGTSNSLADSDSDGVSDGSEVAKGLNPLDGIAFPSGLIATSQFSGQAKDVTVSGSIDDSTKQIAYVATGSHGLAIVDVTQFASPSVLGEINLQGEATSVVVDTSSQTAFVAGGFAGVHYVDVSDSADPTLVRTVSGAGASTRVRFVDGLVLSVGQSLSFLDPTSGDVVSQIQTPAGSGRFTDVFQSGEVLFAIANNNSLHSFSLLDGEFELLGSVAIPIPPVRRVTPADMRLFVAGGVAYVANGLEVENVASSRPLERGGYITFDVSNPENLQLISDIDTGDFQAGNLQTVLNGSGLAVVAAGFRGLQVHDASNPENTFNPIVEYPTPGTAEAVAVVGGIAFVADGTAGLQVINYRDFDALGVAPSVTLASETPDLDSAKNGLQVLEGNTIRIVPTIIDDVQVRSAELLIDGVVTETDLTFPFDFSIVAPVLATGTSFSTVQVRATDTGGNSSVSTPLVIEAIPDTIGPHIRSVGPFDSQSGFFGKTLQFEVRSPDLNTLLGQPTDLVVGPGLEVFDVRNQLQSSTLVNLRYDISDDAIDVQFSSAGSGRFGSGEFNGAIFSDVNDSIPDIVNVTIDPNRNSFGLEEGELSFDANTIRFNVSGKRYSRDSTLKLNVEFAEDPNPLPFTYQGERSLEVRFTEPIDTQLIESDTFLFRSAGEDGVFDTTDDFNFSTAVNFRSSDRIARLAADF